MSIETQLSALLSDRNAIRAALVEQGVDEAATHGFDDFAEDIASIIGGGGNGEAIVVTETPDSHGGTVLEITAVDLSGDTVTPAKLREGTIAHNSSGQRIVGTAVAGGVDTDDATLDNALQLLSGVTAYSNGVKYTGTLAIQHYYTGSGEPSSSTGVNGDIYLKTS